jgi:hypothetical protein
MTRAKITDLGKYKALHDRMHMLQVRFLRQIETAARSFRQEETLRLDLERSSEELRGEAARARQEAEGLPSFPAEQNWIALLERVPVLMDQCLNGVDDAPLQRAIRSLRQVLTEAPRINALLTATASDLRLEQLVNVMKEIDDCLAAGAGSGDGSLPVREFAEGLRVLQVLRPRLGGLVGEHFEWQWLDTQFSVAESQPGDTPEDRFPLWEDFRVRLLRMCGISPDKDWARSLGSLVPELEAAAAGHDATLFRRKLYRFRAIALDRFIDVDRELLALSTQLSQFGDPLDHLLEVITQ